MKIDKMPWWSIIGVSALASMFLYVQTDIWGALPTYCTEAFLFIGLGLLIAGKTKAKEANAEKLTSLMAFTWLINQVLGHWFKILPVSILGWVTAAINAIALMELMGQELIGIPKLLAPLDPILDLFNENLDMLLIALFAGLKIYFNMTLHGRGLAHPYVLWGVAVLVVALGHLIPEYAGKETKEFAMYLPPIGTLIGLWVAFTIEGGGLTLLPF